RSDGGSDALVVAVLLLSAVGFVMLVPYAVTVGVLRRRRAGEKTSLGVLLGVVGERRAESRRPDARDSVADGAGRGGRGRGLGRGRGVEFCEVVAWRPQNNIFAELDA